MNTKTSTGSLLTPVAGREGAGRLIHGRPLPPPEISVPVVYFASGPHGPDTRRR